jgi:hypothetical protein
MSKKLKTKMRGAVLRAFSAGILSDQDVRARGFDPDAVRANHKLSPPKRRKR